MIPLSLIPFKFKILGAGILIAGLLITHVIRVNMAYSDGKQDAMNAVAAQDNARLLEEQAKVAKLEKQLNEAIQSGVVQRAEERLKYANDLIGITDRFQSGAERLRCPSVTVHTPTNSGNPTSPGRPASEEGVLVPGAAAVIQRFARSDYENVRDYNEVVRLYNEMMKACNARAN